jgi:hypothetical protein
MKPVDRLAWYLKHKKIKYSVLERSTGLVHGYMSKQVRSSASIGSDILERICNACADLNPTWLLTGRGNWQIENSGTGQNSNSATPQLPEEMVRQAALEHIQFIDGLPIGDSEKYKLCRAYAEKLILQAMVDGRQKGSE